MLGAIYGDIAGSIYEFSQLKEIKTIAPQQLITENSFYSDDTIETIAVMDAILSNKDYGETLKEYIIKYENYRPNFKPHFKTAFSPETIKWAKGIGRNNSYGNGAMMRISPVGYLFNKEDEVIKNAKLVTIPSHNTEEAIKCATIIALMIYYFRNGVSKDDVFKRLNLYVKYEPFINFNTTCYETLGNCLYAIYTSNSFEDAIKKTLLMGGDTDTNACIVGSVAEALYGMNEKEKLEVYAKIPEEHVKILRRFYK